MRTKTVFHSIIIILGFVITLSSAEFTIWPNPHFISNTTTIDSGTTTGNGDVCGTELQVMDNDGRTWDSANHTNAYMGKDTTAGELSNDPGSIVVGGFTQNKTLVWMSPQEHFWPAKETPGDLSKLPRGCYSSTDYSCDGAAING